MSKLNIIMDKMDRQLTELQQFLKGKVEIRGTNTVSTGNNAFVPAQQYLTPQEYRQLMNDVDNTKEQRKIKNELTAMQKRIDELKAKFN